MATLIFLRSPMTSGLYGCLSLSLHKYKKEKCCSTYDNILQYIIAFPRREGGPLGCGHTKQHYTYSSTCTVHY